MTPACGLRRRAKSVGAVWDACTKPPVRLQVPESHTYPAGFGLRFKTHEPYACPIDPNQPQAANAALPVPVPGSHRRPVCLKILQMEKRDRRHQRQTAVVLKFCCSYALSLFVQHAGSPNDGFYWTPISCIIKEGSAFKAFLRYKCEELRMSEDICYVTHETGLPLCHRDGREFLLRRSYRISRQRSPIAVVEYVLCSAAAPCRKTTRSFRPAR